MVILDLLPAFHPVDHPDSWSIFPWLPWHTALLMPLHLSGCTFAVSRGLLFIFLLIILNISTIHSPFPPSSSEAAPYFKSPCSCTELIFLSPSVPVTPSNLGTLLNTPAPPHPPPVANHWRNPASAASCPSEICLLFCITLPLSWLKPSLLSVILQLASWLVPSLHKSAPFLSACCSSWSASLQCKRGVFSPLFSVSYWGEVQNPYCDLQSPVSCPSCTFFSLVSLIILATSLWSNWKPSPGSP